ncbi:hypothetical protein EG68_00668 [Paragonimus skrjabini miyazakii]|uniref:Aminopeptidase n=1 Tax=Paragonimus skrjabini miyazakii TaxID=59628 RepID=A0A8S9Z608_9TREM|nr:hypothetical protein EG68_00668 [Paragonimus skrjabini miyazakii]
MSTSPEVEKLTKNPPVNSMSDGQTDVSFSEGRARRRRHVRVQLGLFYGIITLLLILLLFATGMAVYYGVSYQCCEKQADERICKKSMQTNLSDSIDHLMTDDTRKRPTRSVRIPHHVLPKWYDVRLQVHLHSGHPKHFFYNGSVSVKIYCQESTDVILVHAYMQLNVSLDKITVHLWTDDEQKPAEDTSLKIENISYDEEMQWFRIKLEEKLQIGKYYRLNFEQFRSHLRPDLKGWYLSSYEEGGHKKYLATSQLQPTDARRVFPCWDEPIFKAKFKITIVRNKEYISLSNMALERSVKLPDDWIADEFRPTVNTSTYLLAFVVCQFKSMSAVDSKGRNFTVWARPELIHAAKYALEIGQKIIRFFEDYYEVDYPLEKTDMVAVPDFLAGAMENWGLIIYREATMLWDPKTGTAAGRQKVATVVSHEIAHQWFGNLVTLSWWDDLWLNEGFASFVENIGVDHVHPEWRMDEQFLLEDVQKALGHDATSSSRPVIQSVHFPKEINELFDAISYNKGASVLRMMESFLGRDTFRLGLRNYLQEFKFKNTVHDDLWRSLTEAARITGKDVDVKSVMETWLMQMNYPLVTAERIGTNLFKLNQSHYLDNPENNPPENSSRFNFQWQIPINVGTPSSSNWGEDQVIWLKNKSMVVEIDIDPSSWYVLNLRQAGFYRVHYADNNWEALTKQLLSDYKAIPVHSRAQIIDDLFSLANRGNVPYSVFLNMTKYLSNEEDYVTWETATRTLRTLTRLLAFDSSYGALLAYIRKLVDRVINQVDWNMMTENENHLKNLVRASVVKLACQVGHRDCVSRAKSLYSTWMADNSTNPIPPSLRPAIYCTAIDAGGQLEWRFLYRQLKYTERDEEASGIRPSLACTRDIWIMKEYINSLLTQDNLDTHDLQESLSLLATTPLGTLVMWEHIREMWKRAEIENDKRVSIPVGVIQHIFKSMSKRASTLNVVPLPEELMDFEGAVFSQSDRKILERSFRDIHKRADQNYKWVKTHRDVIHRWLEENVPTEDMLL